MTYLNIITPTNIASEKAKFFSLKNYSPQFTYDWSAETIQRVIKAKPHYEAFINTVVSQDQQAITQLGREHFEVEFREHDLACAKELVTTTPAMTNAGATEVAAALSKKLAQFNINYNVEIVDRHGFQCRPDHKEHTVRVSKYLHLQFYTAESIATHELVHVIRAVNGNHNAVSHSSNYLATEEGLACYVQDNLFKHPTPSAFQHAIENLAAHISQDFGFTEVYNFMRAHGCSPENAWLRSIRQKFGLCDTSLPGGLMKSGMYFYHEQLLRARSKDDLLRLFVGKISANELPAYKEYSGVIPVEALTALL